MIQQLYFNGANICRFRKKNKMSISDLMFLFFQSSRRKISRQTLLNWESGRTNPDAQDLVVLARVLGVDPISLYNNRGKK